MDIFNAWNEYQLGFDSPRYLWLLPVLLILGSGEVGFTRAVNMEIVAKEIAQKLGKAGERLPLPPVAIKGG